MTPTPIPLYIPSVGFPINPRRSKIKNKDMTKTTSQGTTVCTYLMAPPAKIKIIATKKATKRIIIFGNLSPKSCVLLITAKTIAKTAKNATSGAKYANPEISNAIFSVLILEQPSQTNSPSPCLCCLSFQKPLQLQQQQ